MGNSASGEGDGMASFTIERSTVRNEKDIVSQTVTRKLTPKEEERLNEKREQVPLIPPLFTLTLPVTPSPSLPQSHCLLLMLDYSCAWYVSRTKHSRCARGSAWRCRRS